MTQLSCKDTALRKKGQNCVLFALKTPARYQLVSMFGSVFGSLLGVGLCLLSLCSAQHVSALLEVSNYDGGFSVFRYRPGYELRAALISFHLGHGRTASWE